MAKDYYAIKEIDRKLSSPFVKPGCLFCDVGGARAIDAIPFAAAGAEGICLDISTIFLNTGRKKVKRFGLSQKIDFVCASATSMPFAEGAFDLVTSFSVIDHLPSKIEARKAIMEFSRVVKQGGHVVVTVPNRLFLLGTVMMAAKSLLQRESFFEQRFTPKELLLYFIEHGLQPVRYDSKNPTFVGNSILERNVPGAILKLPARFTSHLFNIATKIFRAEETSFRLRLLGARFGVASVKI